MKKSVLICLFFVVLAISSFTHGPKYPSDVPDATITLFTNEYLETINNKALNMKLEKYFVKFFDKVSSIDVEYSNSGSYYYYVAFGQKDSKDVIQLLKIEKEDFLNQDYTYINFSNTTNFQGIEYCYTGTGCPVCTHTPCCFTCYVICGLWDGVNCSA